MTESEARALLASALLVVLAALGRVLVGSPGGEVRVAGMSAAGDVDSALAVAESVSAEGRRRRRPLAPGERINPNLAGEAELDRLPGVGPGLARAIALERRRHGPFLGLRDLERVPGLGSTRVDRLAPYVALPRSAGRRPAGKLDLNRASAEQLRSLPGIGPVRAQAIERWRKEHGRFRSLDDLLEVPGIGPATLERLRAVARVGP